MTKEQVLHYWFDELTPEAWYKQNDAVDATIRVRFLPLHQAIVAGECEDWRQTPEGALAYIIVLDQFSRNMFRGMPESFTFDQQALTTAEAAIEQGFDQQLSQVQRSFMYLPFMHSESKAVHERALKLYEALGNENNLTYEKLHKRIIDRFGRYPHRNAILGRESTPEELDFLANDEHASF